VESPRTLLHTPPDWKTLPAEPPTPGHRRLARRTARPPRDSSGATAGLLLGRYRPLERLGSGGFGVVWRAHDELLDREVAVKRIPLAPDGDRERASREALATARLAHPAIVALYEACAEEDAFYLISELVHGETLAQLIAADALADEDLLEIGVALAGALSHAHARGVIHRDVKPQNVLVPQRLDERGTGRVGGGWVGGDSRLPALGVAKLTDFGGASLLDQEALTRTGDVLGTLAYMAPEQCDGGEVGEPADLYSLALVLYEALAGVNPVRGATPAATARRIGSPLPPLHRRRADLPPALTAALDKALSPAPADRGTLAELRLALEEALAGGLARRRPALWGRRAARSPALAPAPDRQPSPKRLSEPPPADGLEVEAAEEATAGSLALPRALWLGLALAVILWPAITGRPGVALLLAAAAAPLAVLPRRSGPGWLACVLAPILGLAGLAGAYPALAGQARRWRPRAALGALGYWWLTLAEPLLGRRLWLGGPAGTPARASWEGSLGGGAHVLGPLLSLGVLLGAALWACGALVLPWIVRGRSAALDVVAATTWSAAIVSATPMLAAGLSTGGAVGLVGGHLHPRGAVLGAVLGGALAVAARALRGPI
jgi:serine/threonine protein kinase